MPNRSTHRRATSAFAAWYTPRRVPVNDSTMVFRSRSVSGHSSSWPSAVRSATTAPTSASIRSGERSRLERTTASTESARDARRVLSWLVNTAGWDSTHLLLLTDGGVQDPGDPVYDSLQGPDDVTRVELPGRLA